MDQDTSLSKLVGFFPPLKRRRLGALLAVAALAWVAGGTPGQAAELQGSFRGQAYGTYANAVAGPVAVELGRSAFQPCPCRGTNGQVLANQIDSLKSGENGRVLQADVTRSTVFTEKTATTARIQDTATISGLNALNGLITATTIKAVANVSATATSMTGSPQGSTFVNLKIGGNAIAANVAPNTVINLAGIGKVTLKKVKRSGGFVSLGRVVVDMITVDVTTSNSLGLPVGAQIVVAHAVSAFSRTQPTAVVGGEAYAALANTKIGNSLQNRIGKAAYVTIGCEGTGGQTLTNNVAAFDVGTLLTVGNGSTTAFGGPLLDGSTSTIAKTTATVENVSLLSGLIKASAIKAVAQETFKSGKRTRSTAGSGFVALKVGLISVPLNTPPNTTLTLLGLGKVIINEQVVPSSGGRTQVNGLHIFVTTVNVYGLPIGSEIILAHAEALATRF